MSSIFKAVGSWMGHDAAAKASDFNANVARKNIILSRQKAAADEAAARRRSGRVLGSQQANIGASGFASEFGFGELVADSAAEAELEALSVRHEGALRTAGFKQRKRLAEMSAGHSRNARWIGAGSELLSGVERAAAAGSGGGG